MSVTPNSLNKVAFITGSGRRLGRQIAYAFAEKGYDIVLHANASVDEMAAAAQHIEGLGRQVIQTTADLGNIDEVLGLAEEVQSKIERLDVLVNNAGIFPEIPFEDVEPAQWDKVLNVNTRSMFFLTQKLTPLLKKSKGSVINLVSEGAYEVWLKHIPYNISKAAVAHLTRALAKELAPDVRVNGIAPGLIVIPGEEEREHPSADRIPLKRYGTTQEIGAAALYLADEATYLTGHILPVDGGMLGAT